MCGVRGLYVLSDSGWRLQHFICFFLTPFKDTTHGFQGVLPVSARGILNPLAFLGAQGKFFFEYHLQQIWKFEIRLRI